MMQVQKRMIGEVALAVAYIHNTFHGLHRDIKPGNIFVKRGDPPRLKLGDFGLAKVPQFYTLTCCLFACH